MGDKVYSNQRVFVIGFRKWKIFNLRPIFEVVFGSVIFVKSLNKISHHAIQDEDLFAVWGKGKNNTLSEIKKRFPKNKVIHIEDGFVRSVGLGSDLIRPYSLVIDQSGIYFDPTQPSDLEIMLNNKVFTTKDLMRAQFVRNFIVDNHITKYNIDLNETPSWLNRARDQEIVLVPGQVEDDASILFGCSRIKTNLDLLRVARAAHPQAFVVYKVHPDVLAKNRKGKLNLDEISQYADVIETDGSVLSCINACDVVHTMTSLTGFDALLRGKRVVVYGQPFYSGWGLTEDKGESFQLTRRKQKRNLDELVAGALLYYPIYYDWGLRERTSCEVVLDIIVKRMETLISSGKLQYLKYGLIRRQFRKVRVLLAALLD